MLRLLTAGESHGPALVAILEGLPSGLAVTQADINKELERRRMGHGRGARMSIESDQVRIISGVRHGKTLGSPVTLMIENRDHRNWQGIMDPETPEKGREISRPRPGHADLAGGMKYNHRDFRNILERSSARETAARVAAGAICRKFLGLFNIKIYSQVVSIGGVTSPTRGQSLTSELHELADASPVRCPDEMASSQMVKAIDRAREEGESLGGSFEVAANNVPPGLGSFVQSDRRLDARLAAALVGVPAIKAVEIGEGITASEQPGSSVHDEIYFSVADGLYRRQNNAGGIEGGVSNGEQVMVRAYMKPIPTLYRPLTSVNIDTWQEEKADIERSDVCAVPAASVVGEAVVSLALANEVLLKLGGDSVDEVINNYQNYEGYLKKVWKWKKTLY